MTELAVECEELYEAGDKHLLGAAEVYARLQVYSSVNMATYESGRGGSGTELETQEGKQQDNHADDGKTDMSGVTKLLGEWREAMENLGVTFGKTNTNITNAANVLKLAAWSYAEQDAEAEKAIRKSAGLDENDEIPVLTEDGWK